MNLLQPSHLIIVLVIVVLLFGGAKIPELMRGVGKGMGEFRKGLDEGKKPEDRKREEEEKRDEETATKS